MSFFFFLVSKKYNNKITIWLALDRLHPFKRLGRARRQTATRVGRRGRGRIGSVQIHMLRSEAIAAAARTTQVAKTRVGTGAERGQRRQGAAAAADDGRGVSAL